MKADTRPTVCPGCCAALIRARRAVAGKQCWECWHESKPAPKGGA